MLPRRAECSFLSRSEGGVFRWSTGPRASARAPPLQPVPREQRAAAARRFNSDTHCLHPWEAGAEATEGYGPTASVLRPREGEMPSNPCCSPPFVPRRLLLFVPGAAPGAGGREPRGRGRGDWLACWRQGRKEVKTKQTKNHPPTLGRAAPAQAPVPWAGGNPSQGSKRRSASPLSPAAARPTCAACRRQEPGGAGLSPAGVGGAGQSPAGPGRAPRGGQGARNSVGWGRQGPASRGGGMFSALLHSSGASSL